MRLVLTTGAAAALLAAGCTTSPMKATPFFEGSDSVYEEGARDRVNLWPLYFSRRPATSVLWPLFSEADDHWAIRPFYSQYRRADGRGPADEFNVLWPFCQFDARHGSNWIFPVFWSAHGSSVLPLYYESSVGSEGTETFWALAGLTGWRRVHGRTVWDWTLPLYARNGEDRFYSLIYSTEKRGRLGSANYFLAGLAGRCTDERGKPDGTWFLPFFYQDEDLLTLLFYGQTDRSSWLAPFYYQSDTCSANLLYVRQDDAKTGEGALTIPLALTYDAWNGRGTQTFATPLYGWTGGGTAQTNTWWATPLVGTHAGRHRGWWLFPFYDESADPAFDEKAAALDAETIPPSVRFDRETLVDSQGVATTRIQRKGEICSDDERTWLCLFDADRRISDRVSESDGTYRLVRRDKFGNRGLFNWERKREVVYDLTSRRKLDEKSFSRIDLFFLPVWRGFML